MRNYELTSEMIEKLRLEYGKLDVVVNPEKWVFKFRSLFKQMDTKQIQQLADARVKFVSKLAFNELVRRGLVHCNG